FGTGFDYISRIVFKGVETPEKDVDKLRGHFQFIVPEGMQDILHVVGQLRHPVESHRACHSLYRVRHPENLIEHRPVVRVFLKLKQALVQALKMLLAFLDEYFQVLTHVHYCSTPKYLTIIPAISFSGTTASAIPVFTTALGIPYTTQDISSWHMITPLFFSFILIAPSFPSLPMPVMMTPI